MEAQELLALVQSLEPQATIRDKSAKPAVTVPVDALPALMGKLRDDPRLSFNMLCSHTAVDWLEKQSFELLYVLHSLEHRHYLLVTAVVPREKPVVPSMSSVWRIAEWQEREAYDMFGILYSGHPDLRRILLDDDWQGHPLRKDYKDDFMLEGP